MGNKKKFFLIFLFILLDAFLLIGFLVIRDATMFDKFEKEMNIVSKLSVTEDRFNRKIKTSGSYGIVEKSIKEYLDDYATSLQDVLNIMENPKLIKILSYDNYSDDGPEFKESLSYLKSEKENFNKAVDNLLYSSKEETIISYADGKIDDSYYKKIYIDLILSDKRKRDFKDVEVLLEEVRINVNNVFDISLEILNFLKENKDLWILEDGEIKFKDKNLYNQYNDYISKINSN